MSASLKRHRLVHAHPRIYCICKRRMASAFLRNFLLRRRDRNERASILRREINQNENTERNSECAVVQRDRNKIGKNRREREREGCFLIRFRSLVNSIGRVRSTVLLLPKFPKIPGKIPCLAALGVLLGKRSTNKRDDSSAYWNPRIGSATLRSNQTDTLVS